MLKLTRVTLDPLEKKVVDTASIWIGPSHMVSVRRETLPQWDNAEFTTIFLVGQVSVDVKETPEEIMAMPEMAYAMHPLTPV